MAKLFAGIITKDEKLSESDSQISFEEHTHPLLAKVIGETLKVNLLRSSNEKNICNIFFRSTVM